MGYTVNKIVLYDISHNKNYPIPLPHENPEMQQKFEKLIQDINAFDMDTSGFIPNETKCRNCTYSNLCDYALEGVRQ